MAITRHYAPAALKGPATNVNFSNTSITLPNGQLHRVGTHGEVL